MEQRGWRAGRDKQKKAAGGGKQLVVETLGTGSGRWWARAADVQQRCCTSTEGVCSPVQLLLQLAALQLAAVTHLQWGSVAKTSKDSRRPRIRHSMLTITLEHIMWRLQLIPNPTHTYTFSTDC
jgi:hypothetical protein